MLTRTQHPIRFREARADGAAKTPFYRLHLFVQDPRIFVVRPPLDAVLHLRPETWRAAPSSTAGDAT